MKTTLIVLASLCVYLNSTAQVDTSSKDLPLFNYSTVGLTISKKNDAQGNEITTMRNADSTLSREEIRTNGHLNGISKYYSSGKVFQEITYENGKAKKKVAYWDNGNKKSDELYETYLGADGNYHYRVTGEESHWFEDGKLRMNQTTNSKGVVLKRKEYFPNGKLKTEANTAPGGQWIDYYDNGNKKEVTTYGSNMEKVKIVKYDKAGNLIKTWTPK